VPILFPGTIYCPGLDNKNKSKPKITLKIEERDAGLKPNEVAKRLLDGKNSLPYQWLVSQMYYCHAGVERGIFAISVDLITSVFRASTRGSTPYNKVIVDLVYELIGTVSSCSLS
jgi:3-dehydrosphinganine reductase